MTSILRRTVIAILLGVWSFPAAASAGVETGTPAPIASPTGAGAGTRQSVGGAASLDQAQQYAAREKQAPGLQDFQGGEGYIYIGGGVLTAVLIVLLILVLI